MKYKNKSGAAVKLVTQVELTHEFANTPRLRFKLAPRGYTDSRLDPEWVMTDASTEWGRAFEKDVIREFAKGLLEMVGE